MNNYFLFTLENNILKIDTDFLLKREEDDIEIYYDTNFFEEEIVKIIDIYQKGNINDYLNDSDKSKFLFFIYDKNQKLFFAFNDKFSSNEIFYYNDSGMSLSNKVKLICRDKKLRIKINNDAVYEFLSFQTIVPPNTVYQKIKKIPASNYLFFNIDKSKVELNDYWSLEKLFNPKVKYSNLLPKVEEAVKKTLIQNKIKNVAVSLSGGIDSGGILAMITKILNKNIFSISIGAHGRKSMDLKSARETVKYCRSINKEIYPDIFTVKSLKEIYQELDTPIEAHFSIFNDMVIKEARDMKCGGVVYGFGTNLVLGTQKINKLSYYLQYIEKFFPFFILRILYLLISKIFSISKNQKGFLLERRWVERFIRVKAVSIEKDKKYYRFFSENFINDRKRAIKEIFDIKGLPINEKLVLADMKNWGGYIQNPALWLLCRKYKIVPITPFNSSLVIKHIFKIKNKDRKRARWDKQLIRDVFKKYIKNSLYNNKPKSVIFPYNKWFNKNEDLFFQYLKTSKIINEAIDLDLFFKNYKNLSEPGYSLVRMVGLAIWYDMNWNKKNVKNFDKVFDILGDR